MSDIRPLEPDMVDLSDSSEDSHREDEREEIMQVEDLDVAGQSKESTRGVHEADPNEIEEIGEPSSQGGGTNVENPSVLIPWSDCEGEVSSTLTVQANRENIYCQENKTLEPRRFKMKLRKAVVLQGKIREFLIFPSDLPVKNNLGVVLEVKKGNFSWKCQSLVNQIMRMQATLEKKCRLSLSGLIPST